MGMGPLSLLFQNPVLFIVWAVGLVISITIHEFAHAFVADKLGDPTPRYQGRVTLDPRSHLDPVGTLAILLIGFGWGKAVRFDPFNLKNPKKDIAMIALAGPASNIALATLLSLAIGLFDLSGTIQNILLSILGINVMLAIFNLVPIAPLDGSKILMSLLPKDLALEYDTIMRRYGTFILLGLLIPWGGNSSPISLLISPIIDFVLTLLSSLWFI